MGRFRRSRTPGVAPSGSSAPEASSGDWRDLPAMSTTLAPAEGTFGTADFEAGLITRRPPTFVEGLGHDVSEDGPSGVIAGLLEPTWSAAPPALRAPVGDGGRRAGVHVQRFARAPGSALGRPALSFGPQADGLPARELTAVAGHPEEGSSLVVAPPLVPREAVVESDLTVSEFVEHDAPEEAQPRDPSTEASTPQPARPLGLGPPLTRGASLPVQRSATPRPSVPSPAVGHQVVQRQAIDSGAPVTRNPLLESASPGATITPAELTIGGGPTPAGESVSATGAGRPFEAAVTFDHPAAAIAPEPVMAFERPEAVEPSVEIEPPTDLDSTVASAVEPLVPADGAVAVQRAVEAEPSLPVDGAVAVQRAVEVEPSLSVGRAAAVQRTADVEPSRPGERAHAVQRTIGVEPSRPVDRATSLQRTVGVEPSPTGDRADRVQRTIGVESSKPFDRATVVPRTVGVEPMAVDRAVVVQRAGAVESSVPVDRAVAVQRDVAVGSPALHGRDDPGADSTHTVATPTRPTLGRATSDGGGAQRSESGQTAEEVPAAPDVGVGGDRPALATAPLVGGRERLGSRIVDFSDLPATEAGGVPSRSPGATPAQARSGPLSIQGSATTAPSRPSTSTVAVVQRRRRGLGDLAPLLGGWSGMLPTEDDDPEAPADDMAGEAPPEPAVPHAPRRKGRSFLDLAASVSPLAAALSSGLARQEPDGSVAFAPESAAPPPAGTPVQPATGAPVASVAGGGGGGLAAVDIRSLTTEQLEELSRRLYDKIRDRLKAELRIDRERRGRVTDLVG
jgi:hypothetical protein